MKKKKLESIRDWINTISAIIAIAAGITGFLALSHDNNDIKEQIIQTTRIAQAASEQVTELKKHTRIMEIQYSTALENTNLNKDRYLIESTPYFMFAYSDSLKDLYGDNYNAFLNIGSTAKILNIEYGKGSTVILDYSQNTFFEKNNDTYIHVNLKPNERNKMDFTIFSQSLVGKKYKQRFYDKNGRIYIEIPTIIE